MRQPADVVPVLSAKGTRLNRRGLETRRQVLRAAVECLAAGGPEAASATAVVRHAGVTWGTIQHQFGDVDGLWAAVLDHLVGRFGTVFDDLPAPDDLPARVESIVAALWAILDHPGSRAIQTLRASLPRTRDQLEETWPRTAQALSRWDREWRVVCERAFSGLDVDGAKLMRVRMMLPGAIRGIHGEHGLSSYLDDDDAVQGLAAALSAYLAS